MIKLTAPLNAIKAEVNLSGSKSISNRLLVLKEVLDLDLLIENSSDSEDTRLLQKAIEQIKYKKQATINVHHAGTDMRFLTALMAITEGEWHITGSARMKERPIGELVRALISMGADISYEEKENYPPLLIKGKKLKGGSVEVDSSVSSQFVSALLLIAPALTNGLELSLKGKTVSGPYITMTKDLLKWAGINITQKENLISVPPLSTSRFPSSVFVESDWSSASYWYSICALAGNAEIELRYLNKKSSQADSVLPDLYKDLGVKTTFKENSIILTSIKPLVTEFNYDFTSCPDIAQTVCVTCLGLGIRSTLSGLSTLKVKETDRIAALKNEMEKFGAIISVVDKDSLKVTGYKQNAEHLSPEDRRVSNVSTYNDHRMAMSFAPLALVFNGLCIEDHRVVGKSYPAFWEDLKSVGFNVNLQP